MDLGAGRLRREGMIGHDDGVVQIRRVVGDPMSQAGAEAILVSLYDGLSFEVLPNRGLDIGPAWFAGRPISWRGPLGAVRPHPAPLEWLGGFSGLLVTCGLDHLGPANDAYGLHGSHRATPAHDVSVTRVLDGDRPGVRISGVIDSVEMFGRMVRMHRVIEAFAGEGTVSVRDRIVNEGWQAAPTPVLYHVNFGAPLVSPGATISTAARSVVVKQEVPSIPDWQHFPEPKVDTIESVWEHTDFAGGQASVTSPEGWRARVTWDAAALPRMIQWVYPARGRYALGLEPGNAPIWGPDWEAEGEGAPLLAPGATLEAGVKITVTRSAG